MANAKKRLEQALKNTDTLPDSWFGAESMSIEDLPSVKHNRRVRKNIFVEESTANALEAFCKQHHTSFTDIANDILTQFVKNDAAKKRKVR